jgi:hypothetical protein
MRPALLTFLLFSSPLALAQNYQNPDVDELDLSVGVNSSQAVEVTHIAGSLIKDVKQINLFLNIPDSCDIVYNTLIDQLISCKNGSNRGDVRLTKGCLLKMDFRRFSDECGEKGGIFFPAVSEAPWHPTPGCQGEYCREPGPVWSSGTSQDRGSNDNGDNYDRDTEVLFPGSDSKSPIREEVDPSYTPPGNQGGVDILTLMDILGQPKYTK